jgi:excinuclease ABC subunit B
LTPEQRERYLAELEQRMREAAKQFEFEKAAQLRDRIKALRSRNLYAPTTDDRSVGSGER